MPIGISPVFRPFPQLRLGALGSLAGGMLLLFGDLPPLGGGPARIAGSFEHLGGEQIGSGCDVGAKAGVSKPRVPGEFPTETTRPLSAVEPT
jgi:hypothetical protein